ncbi:MAG TPA: hypothetical protein VFM55_18790 [Micromonosporaceae bacterium]|nr:hypothetical protein [Micromonosporaceae bacterium]
MNVVEAPDFVRPAHCWVPPHASTAGAEAVDLAASAGLEMDPWQAWALDQVLAEQADGSLAAFEAAVIVGRQNGKGAILEALALYWLFLEEVELILWSAHEFKTAAEAFRRMRVLLQGAPDLWPLVGRITTAKGDEAIELTTGQRLKFVARSEASGRGFTGDKIVLDEAYDLDVDEIAAMIPTLATRPDPQIIYTSSAGLGGSHVLRAVRDRGRAGGDPSLCWLEWCATPAGKDKDGKDVYDLDDRAQWRAANPGYGVRISEGFIDKERRAMSAAPERFARERLGVWDEPANIDHPIRLDQWAACAVDLPSRPAGVPVFFLDCSPAMTSAAIAAAALHEGRPHVELADYRPGTDWLVERAGELRLKNPDAVFAVQGNGAVTALRLKLHEVDVRPKELSQTDMGRACAHAQSLVPDGMTHSDDELVSAALAGAVPRDIGDNLWTWGRRRSAVDISPIVAETGALFALEMWGQDYDLADSFG